MSGMGDSNEPLTGGGSAVAANLLETIINTIAKMQGVPELSDLIKHLLDRLTELVDGESGAILLYDPSTSRLIQQQPAYGRSAEFYATCEYPVDNPESASHAVSMWCFATSRPYLTNSPETDPIANINMVRFYGIKNAVSCPITSGGRRIGVVNIINKQGGTPFTDRDAQEILRYLQQPAALLEHKWNEARREREIVVTQRCLDLVRTLSYTFAKTGSLSDIANAIARQLNRNVLIEDQNLNLLASGSASAHALKGWEIAATFSESGRTDPLLAEFLDSLIAHGTPQLVPPSVGGAASLRLMCPFDLGESKPGYISILGGDRQLEAADYKALGAVAHALSIRSSYRHHIGHLERTLKADFLRRLRAGSFGEESSAREAASSLGFSPFFPICAMVLRVMDNRSRGSRTVHFEEQALIQDLVRSWIPTSLTSFVSDCDLEIVSEPPTDEHLYALLQRLRIDVGAEVSIGVGGCCMSLTSLNQSYDAAVTAVTLGPRISPHSRVYRHTDLKEYALLSDMTRHESFLPFIDSVIGPVLRIKNPHKRKESLNTLIAYITMESPLEEIAASLKIHVNTLKYRLRRIQELCNLRLSDPEDRFRVGFAIKAWRVSDLWSPDDEGQDWRY